VAVDRNDAVANGIPEHLPRLYRYAVRLCGSPDVARDAVQDAVSRALERSAQYDPARPLLPWLLTLVRHSVVDRSRAFDPIRRADDVDSCAPSILPQGLDPAEVVARAEEAARVEAALARLPIEQRSAVILFHVEGLTLDEVAAAEGVPVGTVKSRLHRGREAMAVYLSQSAVRRQRADEASGSDTDSGTNLAG